MKRLLWCLLLTGCASITEPIEEEPVCPDGMERWGWSYMDSLGVVTKKDICLPEGTAGGLFKDEAGGV